MTLETLAPGALPKSALAPIAIARVALKVRDLDLVQRFYQAAIGLDLIERSDGTALLGAGGRAFLELVQDRRAAQDSPREAGLFHTAFLLPDRAALAHWLMHAAKRRLALQGASDHKVSEAIYLADPEGNGIEVYADRPESAWRWGADGVTMTTDPLAIDDLLRLADDAKPYTGTDPNTVIGHVHLRTGDIPAAEAFYTGVLGLDVTARRHGATFYSTGGYHHHIATNIWSSRGAKHMAQGVAGLMRLDLAVHDARRLEGLRAGAPEAGIEDPFGIPLRLVAGG